VIAPLRRWAGFVDLMRGQAPREILRTPEQARIRQALAARAALRLPIQPIRSREDIA
jgi:hypothetical protein